MSDSNSLYLASNYAVENDSIRVVMFTLSFDLDLNVLKNLSHVNQWEVVSFMNLGIVYLMLLL